MGSPLYQPPGPAPEQPSPPPARSADDQLVAAIAGLLIIGAGLDITTRGIANLTRLPVAAVAGALEAAGGHPIPMSQPGAARTAYTATKAANRMFRAAFVLAASRRIATGVKSGQDIGALIRKEKANWASHRTATARRLVTAKNVDFTAATQGITTPQGTLVGWYATVDGRTDPTCIAANQTNFYAETPPMIGYPGSVHPHCRCRPGPPHPGAKMTYATSAVRRGPDTTRFYNGGLT